MKRRIQHHNPSSQARATRGSLSLEAALVLPPLLVLLLCFVLVVQSVGAERVLRAAAEQCAAEMEAVLAATELMESLDVAEQLGLERYQSFVVRQLLKLIPRAQRDQLVASAMGQFGADSLLQRTAQLASQSALRRHVPPRLLRTLSLNVELDSWHRELQLNFHYDLAFPFFRVARSMQVPVALWQSGAPFKFKGVKPASDEKEKGDSLWSLGNLQRGRAFQTRYGANLPANYPCLSSVEDGRLVSIRSIDLTAPSYRDPTQLAEVVERELAALAQFDASRLVRDGHLSDEQAAGVSRELSLIIPDNSPDHAVAILRQRAVQALADGIDLVIHRDGHSTRYHGEEEED